jgi:hypothetical protein
MTKVCASCAHTKDASAFSKCLAASDGLQTECKVCNRVRMKKYNLENKTARLIKSAVWRKKNPNYQKQWYAKNRRKILNQRCLLHGITLADKRRLWLEQEKKCAVCCKPLLFKNAHVDHCHSCDHIRKHLRERRRGRWYKYGCPACIRGLLHNACNGKLDILENNPHLQTDFIRLYFERRPFRDLQRPRN